jgi:hypothetical protein
MHEDGRMTQIVHTVLFDLDPEQPDAVAAGVEALRGLRSLPGVTSMTVGSDVSPEGLAQGYTHALVAVFASAADRDHYLTAPEHLAAVDLLKPCMRHVAVVDIEDQ